MSRFLHFYCLQEPSPVAMVPEEGNLNTACFLFPPFQGEIKPPAMRVVVDCLVFPLPVVGSLQAGF